jgi:hypothetical protein
MIKPGKNSEMASVLVTLRVTFFPHAEREEYLGDAQVIDPQPCQA